MSKATSLTARINSVLADIDLEPALARRLVRKAMNNPKAAVEESKQLGLRCRQIGDVLQAASRLA